MQVRNVVKGEWILQILFVMESKAIVLVFDRNPNIRQLLKRELSNKGYKVRLAKSPDEVLKYAYWPIPADIIVLDPDGIHIPLYSYLEEIERRALEVPIIIHGFNADSEHGYLKKPHIFFVEKSSDSIDKIISILEHIGL